MKKLSFMFLVFSILSGCSHSQDFIDVSFYGSRSGNFNLIFDTAGTGLLSTGTEKKVILSESSSAVNPWTALNGGDFYVTTDSDDKMASYGKIVYTNAKLPDGEITLHTFSHHGDEMVMIGSDFNSQVWRVTGEETPVLLGEIAYRNIVLPDGENRTLIMFKGDLTNGKWIGNLGGKILSDSGSGQL